jgi:hypothetical protein
MTSERALSGAEGTTGAGSARGMTAGTEPAADRLATAASDVAERAAQTAQQQVSMRLNGQLSRAGDMLDQVAAAIRQGGDQVRGDMPDVASFTETAAGKVEEASTFLRSHDLDDIVREAESFARRQPVVFIGGALALGLLASRFLKAAPPPGQSSRSSSSFYQGAYAGYTGADRHGGR